MRLSPLWRCVACLHRLRSILLLYPSFSFHFILLFLFFSFFLSFFCNFTGVFPLPPAHTNAHYSLPLRLSILWTTLPLRCRCSFSFDTWQCLTCHLASTFTIAALWACKFHPFQDPFLSYSRLVIYSVVFIINFILPQLASHHSSLRPAVALSCPGDELTSFSLSSGSWETLKHMRQAKVWRNVM